MNQSGRVGYNSLRRLSTRTMLSLSDEMRFSLVYLSFWYFLVSCRFKLSSSPALFFSSPPFFFFSYFFSSCLASCI